MTMQGYYTYSDAYESAGERLARPARIAIVTQGVKLGEETRGYTRFRFLAELLAHEGFEVDLITSSFQHWDKSQRYTTRDCYKGLPYKVRFIYEPGYGRNLDLARIKSHHVFAQNLEKFFASAFMDNPHAYDLIYFEIPPNDMARVCAQIAARYKIPSIVDVNDLWPEAMRMAVNIPVISTLAFSPFSRDAHQVYNLVTAAVGTSDEYAARPEKDRTQPYERRTVYVGNDLKAFDVGARASSSEVVKPRGEFWLAYAGTLGASYDLATLVRASVLVAEHDPRLRVKILGDGPEREALEKLALELHAPVDFVGYAPYDLMAAYLCASDLAINSLVKLAPQGIVTKIGDYLAAGIPLINTGSNEEFRRKVEVDGFGVNVEAEQPAPLAVAILELMQDPSKCCEMSSRARHIAEQEFDQATSYKVIVDLIRQLID